VELQEAAATQADAQARATAQAKAQAKATREAAVEPTIQKLRLELAALEARKSNIGHRSTVTFEDATPPTGPPPGRPLGSAILTTATERVAPTGAQLGHIPGGQDLGHKDDTIFGFPKVSEEEVFKQLIPPTFRLILRVSYKPCCPTLSHPL